MQRMKVQACKYEGQAVVELGIQKASLKGSAWPTDLKAPKASRSELLGFLLVLDFSEWPEKEAPGPNPG